MTTSFKTGTIAGGNYTEIAADGTLIQYGTATTYEDLNFSPLLSVSNATAPDKVTINGVYHVEFTVNNNQSCGACQEIYHSALLSQTLKPHYHCFLKASESAGTTGATFTLYWELRQTTGTTSGSVALQVTSAQLTGNAHKIDIYDPTGFAGPAELGAQLTMVIARTAGNAGKVIVTTYGVHVEKNKLGSSTATAE